MVVRTDEPPQTRMVQSRSSDSNKKEKRNSLMKKRLQAGSDYEEVFAVLRDLALDLRWSWNHSVHLLWNKLDPELWERTRNPLVVLQTVSRERLMRVADTRDFKECLRKVLLQRETDSLLQPALDEEAIAALGTVAYFSMEYMLTEALPIYSGGLGNVAGDQLKAASDLNAPVIGVGLLFQQGYFRQAIDENGEQQAFFPFNNPAELPIAPVRTEDGEWVRVKVTPPGYTIWLRAWQARIGPTTLYLLDTNDPANDPVIRLIGSELYGGGSQLRLRQELILGLGGWRLLRELGIEPKVCHINEGHAAFAVLERARSFMEDNSVDFATALAATRAGNVFTTHTPVEAGFDRFEPGLMESHLKSYAEKLLKIPFQDLLALGRKNAHDDHEPFNMAYLAIRGSGAVNGVSRVHGEVSRRIFQELFPRWPQLEVPVGHVTNGVHAPTWASAEAAALWNQGIASEKHDITPISISASIPPDILAGITDRQLWDLRGKQRTALIEYARKRLAAQRAVGGRADENVGTVLNSEVLTLVFARRFAEYKRPTILLHDPERLARILADPARPAQLILAGKAHPADGYGQSAVKQWNDFIRNYGLDHRVVFLADYDMRLTQRLVRGADVWINTPRRPWEASGTSGMKVLVNGGLNLSELDGWWAEAYAPELGWAIGDCANGWQDDSRDAEQLYALLEKDVKRAFYKRDASGVPSAWIARMRSSMLQLTARFSAHRMLSQYIEEYYRPAAGAYSRRAAGKACVAAEILAWRRKVEQLWPGVAILSRHITRPDGPAPPLTREIVVEVELTGLDPKEVLVELFAENRGSAPFRQPMTVTGRASHANTAYMFKGEVPAVRPESDYTARVVPNHPEVRIPLEIDCITWEK